MAARRYLRYWDWLVLVMVTAGLFALNYRIEQQFDMLTKYHPGWVYGVSFFGPLLTTIYFSRKYRLFDRGRFIGGMPVVAGMIAFLFLMESLPRFVVWAIVPDSTPAPVLQDLDVRYVERHYAKTTYIGSTIGILYGDTALRFESSRTNYFLLQSKRCIRAEIGQAVPGFYYVRHLQLAPGERERATAELWSFWLGGELRIFSWMALFMLVSWLVSVLFRKQLGKIQLK